MTLFMFISQEKKSLILRLAKLSYVKGEFSDEKTAIWFYAQKTRSELRSIIRLVKNLTGCHENITYKMFTNPRFCYYVRNIDKNSL